MKQIIFFLFSAVVIFSSCGKKDEAPNYNNQSSTQNVPQNPGTNPPQNNSNIPGRWWIGQYTFSESAKNVTGSGSQSWTYIVDVTEQQGAGLVATIQIDGFQTMQRLEAKVNATAYDIEFIFDKYGKDNMFEPYKKGDRLFAMMRTSDDKIKTVWDKLKPNVKDNQENGKEMIRKSAS